MSATNSKGLWLYAISPLFLLRLQASLKAGL